MNSYLIWNNLYTSHKKQKLKFTEGCKQYDENRTKMYKKYIRPAIGCASETSNIYTATTRRKQQTTVMIILRRVVGKTGWLPINNIREM